MTSRAEPKRRLTEAEKAYRREYYQRNKKRMNQQTREWRERNAERHSTLVREWYQRNREQHLASSRQWAADHLPEKAAARRRRRAIEAGAAGSCTLAQIEARIAYYGYRCAYCGGPYEELDHVIPLSRGGSNWASNLRPACRSCNRRKHSKTLSEFLAQLN